MNRDIIWIHKFVQKFHPPLILKKLYDIWTQVIKFIFIVYLFHFINMLFNDEKISTSFYDLFLLYWQIKEQSRMQKTYFHSLKKNTLREIN